MPQPSHIYASTLTRRGRRRRRRRSLWPAMLAWLAAAGALLTLGVLLLV
jgi:hypothetical protein